MYVLTNIYNVCGFLWSLIFIMLCFVICICAEKSESSELKALSRRMVWAAIGYIIGMLLILSGIGIFAAFGFLLHFAAQLMLLISLGIFLYGHFKVKERLYDEGTAGSGAALSGINAGIDKLKNTFAGKNGNKVNNGVNSAESVNETETEDAAEVGKETKTESDTEVENKLKAGNEIETEDESETGNESEIRKEYEAESDSKAESESEAGNENKTDNEEKSGNESETEREEEKTGNKSESDNEAEVTEPEEANNSASEDNDDANLTEDKPEEADMSLEDEGNLSEEDRVIHDFFSTPESMLGKRVLLADRSNEDIEKIKEIFRWTAADIITVEEGAEAIQTCRELPCDILILAHRLKDFDGISAFNMIHRDEQGANGFTPGIALTSENKYAREKYINCGFTDVLYKPIDACELRRAVYDIIVNRKPVTKDSSTTEKLRYLEHSGLKVKMGLTNENDDEDLYIVLLKCFRDSSAMREDKIDRLIESISDGDDMWDFLLSQISDIRREVTELGNDELGELFNTIERLIRAEDIESIQNRMPLIKNLWHGFVSMLSVL